MTSASPEERPEGIYKIEGPVWPRRGRRWQVTVEFRDRPAASGFAAWLTSLRDGGQPHHGGGAPTVTWHIGLAAHSMLPPEGKPLIVEGVDTKTDPATGQGHVVITAFPCWKD
jgi:hypothetical protein